MSLEELILSGGPMTPAQGDKKAKKKKKRLPRSAFQTGVYPERVPEAAESPPVATSLLQNIPLTPAKAAPPRGGGGGGGGGASSRKKSSSSKKSSKARVKAETVERGKPKRRYLLLTWKYADAGADDYIDVVERSDPLTPVWRLPLSAPKPEGSTHFLYPDLMGEYRVRYLNQARLCIGSTPYFVLGPVVSMECAVDVDKRQVQVKYSLAASGYELSTWDWIGIFEEDAPNERFVSYEYVDMEANSLTLALPVPPGSYNVRYISAVRKYFCLERSESFVVQDVNSLSVHPLTCGPGAMLDIVVNIKSHPRRDSDWVGLYAVGSSSYLAYVTLNSSVSTKVELRVPESVPPGAYVLKFFSVAANPLGGECISRSDEVTVRVER